MSQNYDSVTIDAGAGDDAVYIYYTNYSSINAGTGSDSLYLYDVRTSTLLGGDGNDTFQGNISSTTLFAGAGDDQISLTPTSSSVMGNEGSDIISLNATSSTTQVTVGYNEGDGDDTIYGWHPSFTFNIMDNKTRDAQSIVGDDLIVTIGSGTVRFVGVGSTNVNIHQGYDITSNGESLVATSGNDVIQNMPAASYLDSVTIDAGAGDDSINFRGNYNSINAGDGNDSMYLYDVRTSTLLGGDGNDTFTGGHILSSTLLAGAGDDVVSLDVWYSSSVMGNEGNDVISLSGYATVGYNEGDGNDIQSMVGIRILPSISWETRLATLNRLSATI
ncbi:MAG: calcium-binding protein [Selenomonadaceae bacterium]|nr:calcium-binding protein [Selenomonadaceae bacterium]